MDLWTGVQLMVSTYKESKHPNAKSWTNPICSIRCIQLNHPHFVLGNFIQIFSTLNPQLSSLYIPSNSPCRPKRLWSRNNTADYGMLLIGIQSLLHLNSVFFIIISVCILIYYYLYCLLLLANVVFSYNVDKKILLTY